MHEDVLSEALLRLIEDIPSSDFVARDFYLAGGTALALMLGHRKSNDLDFFSRADFSLDSLSKVVVDWGGQILSEAAGTVHSLVMDCKVSFFHYPYLLVEPPVAYRKLKVASLEDIACMKIIAVSQRNEKKDFYDLYEILKHRTPEDLYALLIRKYGSRRINGYHILKSLLYFEEAEAEPDPISLNGTKWETVKNYFMTHEPMLRKVFLKN